MVFSAPASQLLQTAYIDSCVSGSLRRRHPTHTRRRRAYSALSLSLAAACLPACMHGNLPSELFWLKAAWRPASWEETACGRRHDGGGCETCPSKLAERCAALVLLLRFTLFFLVHRPESDKPTLVNQREIVINRNLFFFLGACLMWPLRRPVNAKEQY